MSGIPEMPFNIDIDAFEGNKKIANIYHKMMKAKAWQKIHQDKADAFKADFSMYQQACIKAIEETGGKSWSLEKGMATEVAEEVKFNWKRSEINDFAEWIDENGLEHLWKVSDVSLGSAIAKQIFGVERTGEVTKEQINELPPFISGFRVKKLKVSPASVKKYTAKYINQNSERNEDE